MKLRQINDVETLCATSLQYRINGIFIKKQYQVSLIMTLA